MNDLQLAIEWFDELMPHLQTNGRLHWQTLKTHCTQSTDVQQLKPKMPSYSECIDAIGGVTSEPVVSASSAVIGAKRMYDYIARHFGH